MVYSLQHWLVGVDILYEWNYNSVEKLIIRTSNNCHYLHGYYPLHTTDKNSVKCGVTTHTHRLLIKMLLIIVIRSLVLTETGYDLNITSSVPKIDATLYILQNIC